MNVLLRLILASEQGKVDPVVGISGIDYWWCKSIASIKAARMHLIKLHCRPRSSSADSNGLVVKIDITIKRKKMDDRAIINPMVYLDLSPAQLL